MVDHFRWLSVQSPIVFAPASDYASGAFGASCLSGYLLDFIMLMLYVRKMSFIYVTLRPAIIVLNIEQVQGGKQLPICRHN